MTGPESLRLRHTTLVLGGVIFGLAAGAADGAQWLWLRFAVTFTGCLAMIGCARIARFGEE